MNARTKKIILACYRGGSVRNNKDVLDLALQYGLSFAEVYKLLCKEAVKGLVCESCAHLGSSLCSQCSRNKKVVRDHYEKEDR